MRRPPLFRIPTLLCSLVLLALIAPPTSATLPPDAVQFVIITNTELAPEFETLASFKSDIGISSRVVTLDWISAHVEAGADSAATVRRFLQQAHVQWGIEYALLGGTIDLIPTRWVHSSFYPTIIGSDVPADLYFACLDGDWDGDGDGFYGEPFQNTSDPGDEADMLPELALGRAPVSTPAEAALFVAKSLDFHIHSGVIGLPRALLEADVIFPGRWAPGGYIILDGATEVEQLHDELTVADPPWLVDRYYENHTSYPDALNATAGAVLDAMETGDYRLIHHFAFIHGDSLEVGQGYISGDQLSQLTNPAPFFLVTLGSNGAALDGPSPIVKTLLAPAGGSAIGLGGTRPMFPNNTIDYYDLIYQYLVNTAGARIGDGLKSAFTDLVAFTNQNYVHRYTHLTLILLGDPTLPFSATEVPVSNEDHDADSDTDTADNELPIVHQQASLTVAPNPFNPRLEIRGQLPTSGHVRTTVCDVRGREVQVLFNGQHAAGEARWRWNGQDGAGRAVASGVYLVRMETGLRIVHKAVTLAR